MEDGTTLLPLEIEEFSDIQNLGNNNGTESHSTNEDGQMKWDAGMIILSLFLFLLAGIFEIGGGYLFWLALKEKKRPYLFIPLGAIILILYGITPTFQPVSSFGRTFAVYGGFFIVMSYLWAYIFDGMKLDLGDYVGATISIIGVCIAWFWPR